jgi:enoyl-CoA hydratase/carnithine racemase
VTDVRYEVAGGVATITLDNPEARNRLSPDGMVALRDNFTAAGTDDAVRVIVITGTGNTFCAGADLASAVSSGDWGAGPQMLVDALTAMLDNPKPIVGRIQGHVAGGGNGIVACCDVSIAASDAKFAFSEVRVGAAPAVISVPCLMRMHPTDARELLLTGERVSAERVVRAGLVTAAVSADELDGAIDGYIKAFLQCGPLALAHTKDLLRKVPTMPRAEAFAFTSRMSAEIFGSAEAQEGMTAFLTKRAPSWAPAD